MNDRSRGGFSLIEVCAASGLLAGMLVPTLAAMRYAMQQSDEVCSRRRLANYAVRMLEEESALTMQSWSNSTTENSFASDGYASIRYLAERSDELASGGIVGRLMNISVTVYDDANSNSALDAGERQVTYRTKVSRLLTYANMPF